MNTINVKTIVSENAVFFKDNLLQNHNELWQELLRHLFILDAYDHYKVNDLQKGVEIIGCRFKAYGDEFPEEEKVFELLSEDQKIELIGKVNKEYDPLNPVFPFWKNVLAGIIELDHKALC